MSEDYEQQGDEESAVGEEEAPAPINKAGILASPEAGDFSPRSLPRGSAQVRRYAFFSMPLTSEMSSHLLSVIRATTGEEGVGEATSSGLDWRAGLRVISVTMENEDGGTRGEVTGGRAFGWAMAGSLGVVSGSLVAGVLEPITFGVFMGAVAGGLAVALGAGAAYTRGVKRRVSRLMDSINRTMERMGNWPEGSEVVERDPRAEDQPGEEAAIAARNIERLEALQDRREALGPRVTVRRVSYSIAVGATLGALLPVALRFFPTEYPLPWIVVGFLSWVLVRTLRSLFRGIRDRKAIDAKIQALLQSFETSATELVSEEDGLSVEEAL
jgi:hypothetical protein